MHFMHKYTYLINGVYLLTETPRPNLQEVKLPFNIFKESIPLATSYIRWSDDGQTFGHSLHIQESEIVTEQKEKDFKLSHLLLKKQNPPIIFLHKKGFKCKI